VRVARDAYLAENGFSVTAYDASWTHVSAFGIPFRIPNTKRRRVAVRLHDLHHVATGFGTDLAGEGEISAWELHRGLRPVGWYVTAIITAGMFLGLVVAPRRALRAWRASARRRSLFELCAASPDVLATTYERLLAMTVGELRAELGIPTSGIAAAPPRLHAFAPVT